MKEYKIKLISVADFVAFKKMVRRNHLQGKIVQCDLQVDIRSYVSLWLSLPLDHATLIVNDCSTGVLSALDAQPSLY